MAPPSVRPGIPKRGPCPPGWRTVKLRGLFDVMSRPAEWVPDQRYQLVTVKRSRGGVVAREELRGDEIKTPTQFYVLRFLLGAFEAGFTPGVLLYLTCWFPSERRGRMIAVFLIGASGPASSPARCRGRS